MKIDQVRWEQKQKVTIANLIIYPMKIKEKFLILILNASFVQTLYDFDKIKS